MTKNNAQEPDENGKLPLRPANGLADLVQSIQSLPVFVILDSIYSNTEDSPVSPTNPAGLQYDKMTDKLQSILNNELQIEKAVDVRSLPFTSLFSLAEMVVYSLAKTESILLQIMVPAYRKEYIPSHSLNVAFLSSIVGIGLNLTYKELTELCVAALLHDFGMTRIAPDHYFHDGELSPEERKSVESHPLIGYQFFQQLNTDFPWLSRVILEEHRRENNQGYPATKGEELHLYSKIIGLCDSFEALTHNRAHRKALHPADAMKHIIKERGISFSRIVLRAMVDTMGIYPVGSMVQLNNKKIALVVEPVQGSPLRPIVRELQDDTEGSSERIGDKTNLSLETTLYITGLVYDDAHFIPPKDQGTPGTGS